MVRARWAHLLPVASERHTAFAAESVADEVVFVTGPALVTFLATSFAPQAGLVAATASSGRSAPWPWPCSASTEPPAHPRDPTTKRDPMPWGLLAPLTVGAIALGSLFGGLEVATVAFADDDGRKALSGPDARRLLAGQPDRRVRGRHDRLAARPLERVRIGTALLAVGTVVAAVPARARRSRPPPCSSPAWRSHRR